MQSLATYDQSNCAEIGKAADLMRKITRFTSFCRTDTNYTDAEKKVLIHSSLKVFYRLTSIDGEIGITLRHKISKHPFLLRNLSEVLGDITSNYETRKVRARARASRAEVPRPKASILAAIRQHRTAAIGQAHPCRQR
jgi:hypothetical protein